MSFLFGNKSESPEELLESTESPQKDKRLQAVEDIGDLDKNYPEIQERLEYLKDNDKEKKVRKAAGTSLKKLKGKPMADPLFKSSQYNDDNVPDAKDGGTSGTGFDNRVGDSSLQEGEMDVESDLSKEEEDRREMEAEGKGIFVTIKESNNVTLNYQGEVTETGQSTGRLEVANTGSKNRINGIDLYLQNVDQVTSDEGVTDHTHIGMIKAGERWNRNYKYESDLEIIKVEQDFLDPETELSPNFLGGAEKEFENRITITNTLDQPIRKVRGKKILNEFASLVRTSGDGVEFSSNREEITETKTVGAEPHKTELTEEDLDTDDTESVEGMEEESGEEPDFDYSEDSPTESEEMTTTEDTTRMADIVNFTIEEIGAGETVEIVITLKASLPADVPAYTAGGLHLTYDVEDYLTSGLGFESVDGVSDIRQKIRKKQRETEPNMYDAEVTFENMSEFVYQIKEFEVREGDINGDAILEWLGEDATEDEREIVPGERVVFEFVYDDKDGDGNPAFGQHLEYEVQEYHQILSEYQLDLPSQDLRFMALEIKKAYLDENGEETTEFTIPSYVETEIPARVWITGIGTYPLDNVEIVEEIPANFRFGEESEIKVFRNGTELPNDAYEVIFGDPQGPEEESYTSSQEVTEEGEAGMTDTSVSEPVSREDLAGGTRMQINLYNLQDTEDGPFAEGEEISVDYVIIADHLEPQDKPIKTYSYTEGYVNDMPDSRVHDEISDEDALIFNVVHLRDDIDIGKYLRAIVHEDGNAFEIELEAQNYGTSTRTLVIRDLVPVGFEMIKGSMTSNPEIEVEGPETVEDGLVYTWTFEDVAPEAEINATYKLVQTEDDANPRLLQKVYQG